ncbi:MAG: discoidin domain-containing protein, partial [Clostridiales bacterium]|nr:discoidin domain-containing protein [Clostridiales bacterium]
KFVATSARKVIDDEGNTGPDSIAEICEIKVGYVGEGIPAALPTGIALASPPAKTAYVAGEPLDAAGLSVIASFSDGTARELGAGEYRLSGYNSAAPGAQLVTVAWRSFEATFEVTVEALIQGELEYVPSGSLTATASSYTGGSWGEGPENAVDGIEGTKWCTSPDEQLPQWIAIDLGEAYDNVTQLRYFLAGGEWTARIMGHEVWASEDGEAWAKVYEGEWPNVPGAWREANFAPSRARYVRLVATSAGQNEADPAARASAGEIQIGYAAHGPDYPAFSADTARISVTAGQSASIRILKNAAAQALSGIYDIEAPDGIEVVSGAAFAAGSAADEIVFAVSESYTAYTGTIRIVPQSPAEPEEGEEPTRYRAITVTARNDGLGLIDGRTSVIRPAYRAEISGDTEIEFICPGGRTASVFAQKQGDATPNGTRVAIGGIIQLEDGRGVVTFPADEYPKGPITLRIRVWGPGGGDLDDCYLQLYNLGGIDWKAGLAAAPENPVTEGMAVTFSDDFKAMPSISLSGEGTTYASVKPDERQGGQFGYATFENYGGPYDPFSIAGGEYMQITTTYRGDDYDSANARWNQKATTGFLSSLAMDGSGFRTQGGREQYFEVRIFLPPTPGMWPAFWTLTADNYADNKAEYAGVDELDILEGYMAWPDRYAIANHAWLDTNPSKNLPQSQVWPSVDTERFGHVNLAMGFHTFGMHIAEDVTRYYYDNVEVHSHPTMALSWESGNYFMINGAISDHVITNINHSAGTYDYDASPKSFFRYGDENNMYIDWVRVYEEDPNVPSFKAEAAHVVAPLGEEFEIAIKRNAAAQELAGVYEVALPDGGGWEVVAGAAFEAGSELDAITLRAPEADYLSAEILATPVAGGVRYPAVRFAASPSDAAGGELVAVNASTLPYVGGAGQGPWAEYSGSGLAGKPHSFNFSLGGNWWSDSWGWMYTQNPAQLEFAFEGTSIALKAIKGDYGGEMQIYLDGELADTVNLYSASDEAATVFERAGLPAARHKILIKSVSGAYTRLAGIEYTYVPAQGGPGGELVAVDSATYPHRTDGGGTGGPWSMYSNPSAPAVPFRFDFGLGGNWWSDSWGWMYTQNQSQLEFAFEGTSILLRAFKGDYGGATEIWLDGELAAAVDTYSAADSNEVLFERANLPAAEHKLLIKGIGGQYLRITGFEFTYVPLGTVPAFTSDIAALRAEPGATLSYLVKRNAL